MLSTERLGIARLEAGDRHGPRSIVPLPACEHGKDVTPDGASRRLRIRYERDPAMHTAFLTLACAILCWRRL